ncbi:tRNA(adenine34) deaminase [Cadophora gregata]|uniref:tRNA(adenine34) deaminase n=1 Tax=Cadophora gregata TaxID=51156 RepID=UPI0026DC27A7|nr:tRNA(adenine34) deaminase [Cadophora gregata]KAK0105264.1 tRNA(adenine34) deaminase [Cadophora gregata f. sp. sojae]KAK0105833.1 tRNA(adenine34) deaminase [Cadophora gregata]
MTEEEIQTHLSFMREALAMAELALQTSETPVGCVFVHNGVIIGRGMNATNRTYNGTRHAEFIGINEILTTPRVSGSEDMMYSPEVLKECDLYVTVEPCIMCASLLRQFGVRRVFYGASNEKFGGTGGVLNIQRENGRECPEGEGEGSEVLGEEATRRRHWRKEKDYEVSGGWLREEAIVVLRRFYVQENDRAPEPRAKKDRVLKLEVERIVTGKAGD